MSGFESSSQGSNTNHDKKPKRKINHRNREDHSKTSHEELIINAKSMEIKVNPSKTQNPESLKKSFNM